MATAIIPSCMALQQVNELFIVTIVWSTIAVIHICFDVKLKDGYWPDFYINTEDIQYNPANGEQFIDGKKIDVDNPYSKSDDDEKDRYEAFEKDNGVVKVIISRTRERNIHYMV